MLIFLKKIIPMMISAALIAATLTVVPCTASAEGPSEPRQLKVLAIGNSFSEDATRHLYKIAEAAGAETMVIGNLYIGGCSLATHRNNAANNSASYQYQKNSDGTWVNRDNSTMEYGITDEDWDVISIQQVSGLSGIESTYNEDIDYLIDYINSKKTNKEAKIAWHMTWAYQSGSTHSDFPKYNSDQRTMYTAIFNAVRSKIESNPKIDIILPSGTAIQNVRTSYIGDTITRDGYHLSYNLGRYIAGLTWLKAITGWSIDDISYVPSSTEIPYDYLPLIKEAVNNAVDRPFSVSQSSYISEPVTDYTKYNQLQIDTTTNAYWNSGNGGYSAVPATITNASNSKNFIASTNRFTKEDFPVGTVIEVDEGYQYRPEGWTYSGRTAPGRPGNITSKRIVITDDWWNDYEYRAFNIAYLGNTADVTGKMDEIMTHFRIYIPKSSACDILSFKVSDASAEINGTDVLLALSSGTDLTSITPEIEISPLASIAPQGQTDFASPVTYTVTAEDGTQKSYTVTISLPSSACDILSFEVGDVSAEINGTDVLLALSSGTDLTSITPEIEISPLASIAPQGQTDFASPVTYTVTAEDGTQKSYTVTISLIPSVIPGDMDNDGITTVSDVVALRKAIINGKTDSNTIARGDLNNDGLITVSDVVALRKLIMEA